VFQYGVMWGNVETFYSINGYCYKKSTGDILMGGWVSMGRIMMGVDDDWSGDGLGVGVMR